MTEFSIGDVVVLKAGGPKMTVTLILSKEGTPRPLAHVAKMSGYVDGDLFCSWFISDEKKNGWFRAAEVNKEDA